MGAFEQKIPRALKEFKLVSKKHLEDFHGTVTTRVQEKARFSTMNTLESQLRARTLNVGHVIDSISKKIVAVQRQAHRKMRSAIMEQMQATYLACAQERGKGCFIRMQNLMFEELAAHSLVAFRAATAPVKEDLTKLCEDLQTGLGAGIADMLDSMKRDYANVIPRQQPFAKSTQKVRKELFELLEQVDKRFQSKSKPNPEPVVVDDI